MKRCFVITSPHVKDTGTVSFKFMFDSKAPSREFLSYNQWGVFRRSTRDEGTIDPFAVGDMMAGRKHGEIDISGTPCIQIFLFESGKGNVLSGGSDESPEAIDQFMTDADDACLLVQRDFFDKIEASCKRLDIDMSCHHCETPLATS